MTDTSATDTTDASATSAETDTDSTDWKAEAEKYRALHRKQEDRAKANADAAKELATLKQQSMSDTEKAVAQARVDARAEALREVGGELVDSAVRVAAAGRTVDVDALLEGLDRSRFVGDDGRPDQAAIGKWMERIAPAKTEETKPGFPDLGQGVRGQQGSLGPAEDFARFLTAQRKG